MTLFTKDLGHQICFWKIWNAVVWMKKGENLLEKSDETQL